MWTLSKNHSWPALEAQFGWLADMRGVPQDGLHHAEGDMALLERIDFFEAFCQEQDCWGAPFPFPSANSRYHYFHHSGAAPGYQPFDDSRCEVVMMSGLPGMGKDHYLQKHHPDLPVISLDAIRQRHRLKPTDRSANGWVAQQARESARELLRKGVSFTWNATNLTRMMREGLTELFSTYKARIRMVYVEVPYRQWLAQNRNRAHPVPEAVMERMLQKLEVPQLWEAQEVVHLGSC